MTQNQSNSTNCPGCTNEFCEATHLLLSSNFGVNPKDNNEKPVCLGMYSPQTPLAKDEPTVKHQNEIHTGKKRKRNAEVVSSNDILDECNDMPRKKVFLSFGIDQILSKEYKGGNSISLENTDSGYTTGSLVCSSLDDQRIQAIMLDSQIPECNQDASNETCIEVNPLQSDCQNSLTVETDLEKSEVKYLRYDKITVLDIFNCDIEIFMDIYKIENPKNDDITGNIGC
ncbi:hypothetical protein GJ496_007074 [Pomphorhynchus laevis]|nr:hypothetical protein GJ496_007074 [Pomphorhynchus laevis]